MVATALRFVSVIALVLLGLCQKAVSAPPNPDVGCTLPNVERPAPTVSSYRIVAVLDPDRHRIEATAVIRWRNPSLVPTDELYLHAYLNAFAHSRTRFLRSGVASRRVAALMGSPGGLIITRLVARELGDLNLLPNVEANSPNDPDDATDLRVRLPVPVAPGSTLTLEVEFESVLPSLLERTGYSGTFHAIAQWFPKLAYRDVEGSWHHFAYAPLAEFSSDFGDYDITIDVPSSFIVAAPGTATIERSAPQRRREHYCLSSVHDFAWFAWDHFVVTKATARNIELRHYASTDQRENAQLTLAAIGDGLDYFGQRFTPYPYKSLTIVHPPDRASAAGGMEYPQLITTGGPWYLPRVGFKATEAVTLHELAHQWFYGIVASNEYLAPVLDEGLTSWAESTALARRFGVGSLFDSSWLRVSEAALRRVYAQKHTRLGPLALAANEFGSFTELAGRVYARFPTLFETLQRVFGVAVVDSAVRAYVERYRFRHPTPQDFVEAIRPHLPARATDAVTTAMFANGWVDYAVRAVTSNRTNSSTEFANRVLLERQGNFDFPVVLRVEFEDGRVAEKQLESVAAITWIDWPASSPIITATLDPDHRITIDDNLDNQSLHSTSRSILPRLATALHFLLSAVVSLGWP